MDYYENLVEHTEKTDNVLDENGMNLYFLKALEYIKAKDPSLICQDIQNIQQFVPSVNFLQRLIMSVDSPDLHIKDIESGIKCVKYLSSYIQKYNDRNIIMEAILLRMTQVRKSTRDSLSNCFDTSSKCGDPYLNTRTHIFKLLHDYLLNDNIVFQLCAMKCIIQILRYEHNEQSAIYEERKIHRAFIESIVPLIFTKTEVTTAWTCGDLFELQKSFLKFHLMLFKQFDLGDYITQDTCIKAITMSCRTIERTLTIPPQYARDVSSEIWPCRKWATKLLTAMYYRYYMLGISMPPCANDSALTIWYSENLITKIAKMYLYVLKQHYATFYKESALVLALMFLFFNILIHERDTLSDQLNCIIGDLHNMIIINVPEIKSYAVKFLGNSSGVHDEVSSLGPFDANNTYDKYFIQVCLNFLSYNSNFNRYFVPWDGKIIPNQFIDCIRSTDIAYIFDKELINACNQLPSYKNRASMVHELIQSYGLLDKMMIIPALDVVNEELSVFHNSSYLEHIKNLQCDEDYTPSKYDAMYGLAYDCPPINDLYKIILKIAGASITAADLLARGQCRVAINWCGGWHHAEMDRASGFCYVNDIVLAIEKLKKTFDTVVYIDLDVHHGNAVENAFKNSKQVLTMSFHKFEPGFFPQSGSITNIGEGPGEGYCINFPFKGHYSDESFLFAFKGIWSHLCHLRLPNAVVIQCGADVLSMDPVGHVNVTPAALSSCIEEVLKQRLPLLLLGGGGYNSANTARCWTYITSRIAGVELDNYIPDNNFFTDYGPDYTLEIQKSSIKDENDTEYLKKTLETVLDNIKKYIPRPNENLRY